jgi:hypothetical protein
MYKANLNFLEWEMPVTSEPEVDTLERLPQGTLVALEARTRFNYGLSVKTGQLFYG